MARGAVQALEKPWMEQENSRSPGLVVRVIVGRGFVRGGLTRSTLWRGWRIQAWGVPLEVEILECSNQHFPYV